jgi:hypothetical protein
MSSSLLWKIPRQTTRGSLQAITLDLWGGVWSLLCEKKMMKANYEDFFSKIEFLVKNRKLFKIEFLLKNEIFLKIEFLVKIRFLWKNSIFHHIYANEDGSLKTRSEIAKWVRHCYKKSPGSRQEGHFRPSHWTSGVESLLCETKNDEGYLRRWMVWWENRKLYKSKKIDSLARKKSILQKILKLCWWLSLITLIRFFLKTTQASAVLLRRHLWALCSIWHNLS